MGGGLTAARAPAATALPRASPAWGAARSVVAKAASASWKVAKVSQARACPAVPPALTCGQSTGLSTRHRHWHSHRARGRSPW